MVGGAPRHVVGYMKDFLFAPEQLGTPIERLSGGERGRLMLARALAKPSNLLVLDEPTNDLDLETLDLLQELLADYAGTLLLVSHDRDFLDRVVTSTVACEGDGRWTNYAGGYTDMLAQRGADLDASELKAPPKPKAEKPAPTQRKQNRNSPTTSNAPWKPCRARWKPCRRRSLSLGYFDRSGTLRKGCRTLPTKHRSPHGKTVASGGGRGRMAGAGTPT